MGFGTKLFAALGGVAALTVAGFAIAKAKSKASGTPAGGGSLGVKGKSGIEWLLTPTGQQMGPAYGTMAWDVFAAPGTKFKDDTGLDVAFSALTPVIQYLQVASDVSTRSYVKSYVTGKGWSNLVNAALSDLGIKTG